jgi:hypothetical protein
MSRRRSYVFTNHSWVGSNPTHLPWFRLHLLGIAQAVLERHSIHPGLRERGIVAWNTVTSLCCCLKVLFVVSRVYRYSFLVVIVCRCSFVGVDCWVCEMENRTPDPPKLIPASHSLYLQYRLSESYTRLTYPTSSLYQIGICFQKYRM